MRRLSVLGIVVALACAVLPGSVANAADSSLHQVTIEKDSFAFTPQALAIHQGDRIRWTNNDGQMHMIVTTKPDSNKELELYQRVNPGESFEHEFTTAAAYYYYCAIHFQMWGIISVNP